MKNNYRSSPRANRKFSMQMDYGRKSFLDEQEIRSIAWEIFNNDPQYTDYSESDFGQLGRIEPNWIHDAIDKNVQRYLVKHNIPFHMANVSQIANLIVNNRIITYEKVDGGYMQTIKSASRRANRRANRKRASNDLFDRLLFSPGVFSVGISGDIMAYVDLPSDEIPSGGTNFYWVVIDSNGDEIVGGASSSFEEAKSLAEANLFRLSRELYPETYTSRRANRRVAYYDDYPDPLVYQGPTYPEYSHPGPNEWDYSTRDKVLSIIRDNPEVENAIKDVLRSGGNPRDVQNIFEDHFGWEGVAYDMLGEDWLSIADRYR